MKYAGMPMGMWVLFAASFRRQLTAVFGYDKAAAASITKASKSRYKEIIARLPEFEREDQFRLNIVGCAMLCAFILSMPQRPEVDRLTDYYAKAMMTAPMRWFCRMSGKSKFTGIDYYPHGSNPEMSYRIWTEFFSKLSRSADGTLHWEG